MKNLFQSDKKKIKAIRGTVQGSFLDKFFSTQLFLDTLFLDTIYSRQHLFSTVFFLDTILFMKLEKMANSIEKLISIKISGIVKGHCRLNFCLQLDILGTGLWHLSTGQNLSKFNFLSLLLPFHSLNETKYIGISNFDRFLQCTMEPLQVIIGPWSRYVVSTPFFNWEWSTINPRTIGVFTESSKLCLDLFLSFMVEIVNWI